MKKTISLSKMIFLIISLILVCSCSKQENGKPSISGSFEGQGKGFLGEVSVKVIIEENKIKHIDILEYSDTPGYSNVVFEYLPKKTISANSTEIDTISGATITSKAFLEAVKDALKKADIQ